MKRLALLVLALSLVVAGAAAAAPKKPPKKPALRHTLFVYGEGESAAIAKFTTATCTKSKGSFLARMESTDGKHQLFVKVFDFHGFKAEYEIEAGPPDPNPAISFETTSGGDPSSEFSNRFAGPPGTFGFGEVLFREGGRLLGVGYGPSMFSRDGAHAVFLTGVVSCSSKKKR